MHILILNFDFSHLHLYDHSLMSLKLVTPPMLPTFVLMKYSQKKKKRYVHAFYIMDMSSND